MVGAKLQPWQLLPGKIIFGLMAWHPSDQMMSRTDQIPGKHFSNSLMKAIPIFFIVSMLACSTGPAKPVIKGSLLHQTGKGYTLFVNLLDTTFYMIQFKDSIPFPVPEASSFQSKVNDTLTIKDLANDSLIRYSLDQNLYGIGTYTGNEYFELLTDGAAKDFKFRDNIGDLISLISCQCHPVGEIHNCPNNGDNDYSCISRNAHRVGKDIWVNKCEIQCSQGYKACCN
ncbi:MAG: hypothetical protein ABJB16_18090 [Saprospiraceae bacterium]